MLVIHRLSRGGHRYYLGAVGPEGTDLPRLGEAPGRWSGRGAVAAGLSGEVVGADLRAILPSAPGRVPGWDLTFAAPKSVSVLHGLADPPVSERVRRAHDEAVAAGLAYLEAHACATRLRGETVAAAGFVVASFRHRVSRSDDPHLHTHCLVANRVAAAGRHGAVDASLLYRWRRGASAVYHSVLRDGLALDWDSPVAGRADLAAVPPRVRAAFSQRRAAVLATGIAFTDRRWSERVTRPERDGLIDLDRLEALWRHRAAVLEWSPPSWSPRSWSPPSWSSSVERASTPIRTPDEDRWDECDLAVAIADASPSGASLAAIEGEVARVLARSEVVRTSQGWSTTSARARQERLIAALPVWVDAQPIAIDRFRRALGGKLLIVSPDQPAAVAIEARTGAVAAALPEAASAIERLDLQPADAVAIVRPERLDSRLIETVMAVAGRRGVPVGAVARADPRWRPPVIEPVGPIATVPVDRGSVTVAGSAAGAADTAIADWAAARLAGRRAVLVVPGSEVAAVNAAARRALRELDLLGRENVAGLAVGDCVRFTGARPSLGVMRHDIAWVEAVDAGRGRATLLLDGDRRAEVVAASLVAAEHAHAVPPMAPAIAGRGDVFMVGDQPVAPRHVGGDLHHYLTSPRIDPFDTALPEMRRVGLARIERVTASWRARAELPPSVDGERRRWAERMSAAAAWEAESKAHIRHASSRRDETAEQMWRAQLEAARREVDLVRAAATAVDARAVERARAEATAAPARRMITALDAQANARVEALVRAAERAPGMARKDAVERTTWRSETRSAAIEAELGRQSAPVRRLASPGLALTR